MKQLLLIICFILFSLPLPAKEKVLSKATYEQLLQSQQFIENGQEAKAIQQLKMLAANTKQKAYEHAVVLQTLAHAYISKQQYNHAIQPLKQCLELSVLPDDVMQRQRYNLAQLYLSVDDFKPAVKLLLQWIENAQTEDNPTMAQAHAMLGSAYLQLKNYRDALAPLRQAIAISESPRENWYQSLLGALHELKMYKASAELLRKMIALFPGNQRYWKQLAGIELLRERHADAAAVLELAWLRGDLNLQHDQLQLAQLYLHLAEPFKAAKLLETGMADGTITPTAKHWRLAGNAWCQAREMTRCISALKQAQVLEVDLQTGLHLAQLNLETGDHKGAIRQLEFLLEQNRREDKITGEAWLLLGIAYFENQMPEKARTAFQQAGQYEISRETARQWERYL